MILFNALVIICSLKLTIANLRDGTNLSDWLASILALVTLQHVVDFVRRYIEWYNRRIERERRERKESAA